MYDGWQFCILKMVLIATGVKQLPSEYYRLRILCHALCLVYWLLRMV